MTLEKLLIFGFAIALVTALTVAATRMVDDQKEPYTGYKDELTNIVEQAK